MATLTKRDAARRGMALVLTLACIAFLAALTLRLLADVGQRQDEALLAAEETRLDALVLGGLQLARAALALDRHAGESDSFLDAWNRLDAEKIRALANDADTDFEVLVADMGGRLQVNALGRLSRLGRGREEQGHRRYRGLWRRFLASGRFAVAEEDIDPLLDALADWVDRDHEERPLGAEDGGYLAQEPPYAPRNAAILSEGELLLVRGMTAALLYGDAEHEGIAPYITLAGDDAALNPNTAPLPVLMALLPGMSEDNVRDIDAFRKSAENRAALESPDWLAHIPGLPPDLGGDMPTLTVKSSRFAVQIRAESPHLRRVGDALIERRDGGEQNLLWWRID